MLGIYNEYVPFYEFRVKVAVENSITCVNHSREPPLNLRNQLLIFYIVRISSTTAIFHMKPN